eukprot:366235-Chlamydomonas_euryale.AAC.4
MDAPGFALCALQGCHSGGCAAGTGRSGRRVGLAFAQAAVVTGSVLNVLRLLWSQGRYLVGWDCHGDRLGLAYAQAAVGTGRVLGMLTIWALLGSRMGFQGPALLVCTSRLPSCLLRSYLNNGAALGVFAF